MARIYKNSQKTQSCAKLMSGSRTAPNVPDAVHTQLMNQQRDEIQNTLATFKKDAATCDIVDLMEVLSTMWCDPSRKVGSCYGDNITDVRLESRRFKWDDEGNKVNETAWTMCQIIQTGSNFNDPRSVIPAEQFELIVADDDGENKRSVTLKDLTAQAKEFFPSEGLEAPKIEVDKVAVAFRMAFVPMPSADSGWECEIRYVCYGYNTVSHSAPTNLLLFGDTMNTSLFSEEPGSQVGFQGLYSKLCTTNDPETGSTTAPLKTRCYATAVEATDRDAKDIGTEKVSESRAAAAAGKGTQVRTGPISVSASSSSAWHIAIGIAKEEPEPTYRSGLGSPFNSNEAPPQYQSLSAGADDGQPPPAFRSLGGGNGDKDQGFDPQVQAAVARAGGKAVRVAGKEGRIGLGTFVEDAKPLPNKSPVALSGPAIATSITIMTIPMGTVPDEDTILEACKFLKKRHKQTVQLGVDVASRHSDVAVKAGLSTTAPLSKRTLDELEKTIGSDGIKGLAKRNISKGRPLISGMPME